MKILMHENQLCERGTTQALLDYARGLTDRGHQVLIAYPRAAKANQAEQIELISREFPLAAYDDRREVPEIAQGQDSAYFIKSGHQDGIHAGRIRTVVHSVFKNYEPHGSYYAYVSDWLASHMRRTVMSWHGRRGGLMEVGREALADGCENALAFDAIPHACEMPPTTGLLRSALSIPEEAFVILRYGGYDTFDLDWAARTVARKIAARPNWYFVGVNTRPFMDHKRALFLPPIFDRQEKSNLLASADVFLTAGALGESFGLAHVEALQMGLPVLAWRGGDCQNHTTMLDGLGTLYRNDRHLDHLLTRASVGAFDEGRLRRQDRGNEYRTVNVVPKLEAALIGSTRSEVHA